MVSLRELSVTELREQLERCTHALPIDNDELASTIYDLQVYQIELEIQNRELRETQQQLEISRNRYAELYDFAPISYLSLTSKGIICEINVTAAVLFEQEPHHLMGYPLFHFIHPDYRSLYLDHLFRCNTSERAVTELLLRTGKTYLPVELISRNHSDLEHGTVFRTAIADLTERKRTEEMLRRANVELDQRVRERTAALEATNARLQQEVLLKEKMSAAVQAHAHQLDELHHRKDEFLAMLAHELRNPLAPLTNGLQLLKITESNPEMSEWTEMMDRQLKQMVRLVDDLLDVSRVMRGKIALCKEHRNLNEIVRHAVEQSYQRIRQRNHELILKLPEEGVWLDIDATRLQQVITNLLNNAAKFTDTGGRIELILSIERDEAVIRVIDNGCGISRELLPHVFELFTQGERTLDRSSGGLGIGLTLANTLVRLHDGYIQAFSAGEGCGAEFVVRIPLSQENSAVINLPASADEGQLEEVNRRILIVDDNEDMARSTAAILRLWGHTVDCAASGPAALGCLQDFRPDIVLLDIGLPDMDGYAVAERVRELVDMGEIILIGISGYGAANYKQRALAVGFDEYMVKPIDLGQLRKYLTQH